jgi:formyltetrahydrofolate deformylase
MSSVTSPGAVRDQYIQTMSCPDRVGVVAAISSFFAARGANITETQHFRDPPTNRSYMRTVFEEPERGAADLATLERAFEPIAGAFGMQCRFHDASHRLRVLVAVSRQGHCLNSLLNRWHVGTLPIEVVGVVSNHEEQRRLVEWYGLPYHHLPITEGAKAAQEERLLSLFDELRAELLVLARYMQIFSQEACGRLAGRAINIHHAFLPGFAGARPYHQAYERGVKLIGATAHYVTPDLDDGPIIEQAVERVDHTMDSHELTTIGHDTESAVLNRAVRWHAERRIFVHGRRTVVLR